MKYNLTFLEAIKALNEGRCKAIENEYRMQYVIRNGTLNHRKIHGIEIGVKGLLGKWRLIDFKSKTEPRILRYWIVIYNDGKCAIYTKSPDMQVYEASQRVKACSFEYMYEFPEEE